MAGQVTEAKISHAVRLPVSIDIRVAGVCNLRCPFCFGPRHYLRAARFSEIVRLIPSLFELGTRTIVVTGGEPLMVKRLPELLAAAKSLQMQVVLSTNGTLVQRRHADILPLLDWIALPLDGHDAATHETARPGKVASFWRVIESISFIRESYPEVKIKLGTVVSKLNVDAVAGIPATVARDAYSPDIWKIYQTSYSNYGADNREDLHLSNDEFEKVVGEALASAAEFAWSTIVYRNSERSGKYLFIEPSGDAMVIVDSQEMVIGNFLDDFNDAVGRWSVYVSNELLASNVVNTYF